jgi:succinate dehydrogenase / fumarate reductase membrane anchor subunit
MVQWLVHRITGAFLLAGLFVHFMVMHFTGHEQITHEYVRARLTNPYWKAFDLLFLFSAVYHGYNGLWGIVLEYLGSSRFLRIAQTAVLMVALLLIVAGINIIVL